MRRGIGLIPKSQLRLRKAVIKMLIYRMFFSTHTLTVFVFSNTLIIKVDPP
jgi:hypothetical protein